MIFKYQVEHAAKKSLETRLATNKNALEYLTHPSRFNLWVDLLHVRCNELTWAIKSRFALLDFIDKATVEFAKKQLDKAEINYSPR